MVKDVAALVAEEESMESTLEAALHQYLGVEVDGGEQLPPPPAPEEIDPAPRIFFASDCVDEPWGEYTDPPNFQGATQLETARQKSKLQGLLHGVLLQLCNEDSDLQAAVTNAA